MRSTCKLTAVLSFTLAVVASGCASGTPGSTAPASPESPDQGGGGDAAPSSTSDGGTGVVPPAPVPAPTASYSGVYDVTSPIDFGEGLGLPELVGPLLEGLAELHDHPGDALYTILENADIPYISDLMSRVPDVLRAGLTAMLDRLIVDHLYQGYPIADQVSFLVQGIAEVSQHLEVHALLTIHTPASDLGVAVDQQLTAIGFQLFGATQVVALPAASLPAALAHLSGRIAPAGDAPVADAALALGSGSYSLPVGRLLVDALGPLLFSQLGGATDLAGALEQMVPCADFGQSLVDGSGGLLGDPAIGQELCEGALRVLAQAVESRIAALTLDGITVDGATATLYDASQRSPQIDHQSDHLGDGTWTWRFRVGASAVQVGAVFAGDRVAAVK